jgi:pilus assembly protein Flp/PilA
MTVASIGDFTYLKISPSFVKMRIIQTDHPSMKLISEVVWKLRIWKDTRGQDLIEYALMAGFVAVAAGAIMPGVATSISTIFSSVASTLTNAANQS